MKKEIRGEEKEEERGKIEGKTENFVEKSANIEL